MHKREKQYKALERAIGNTSLVQYANELPNNNRIHIKRELDNPFGSHYDRVYLDLFKYYEEKGIIKPGDKILETSSGSAGVSFAGIGKLLGYHCITAMPAGGEKARESAIIKQLQNKDDLILTPSQEYVNGFIGFLKEYLSTNKDVFFLNHSMGSRDARGNFTENKITTGALRSIATEVLDQTCIDFYVAAIGNGSSIVGPSREFSKHGAKTIGFETVQSAAAYEQKYPGKYQQDFGIKPGSMGRNNLPGTSFPGIDFPHLRIATDEYLDDIVLISGKNMDEEYTQLTGRDDTKYLAHWDKVDYQDIGRSSRAALATSLQLANTVKDKDILMIAYDSKKRYDL